MADKRIQYTLGFNADTSKAKAQLKDLQNQLNQLGNTALNKSNFDYSTEIGKSIKAVNQLQTQLHQSTNKTTGILDLNKFNESLKKSGTSLKDYSYQFSKLGNDGTRAFLSLTESILNAEKPLHRTSKILDEMKVSLSNTIKWQLSSSAIHGFMGAVQGAYGYAQDLNKSLNDIRIVTGRSADEMAEFAKQANNSAKALSTSTVKYAEAALIYYQQGLTDEQVKARTDTTVKMANVTGESATDVSSYMTAIWNNFAKGSDNLEYFSDVITALGAATAASSEEIAGGLEKFAAVGETVGLSYEYATAALTTIIDKTRQSEDVVGTALKTIFARIQGLQQGETAEDGVTLNKYSSALANVGIQIIDTSGNLKEMDQILDELGQKWQTLGKAEQVALAQTVGGTRQYTQLIALMDNWGSMQENLNTAYNSEGALQKQADIYAESWEAAQNRVTAALQDIYDSLLNDKFFIGLTNIFAELIEQLGNFIDSLGGAGGLLSTLGVIALKVFEKDIKQGVATAQSYIRGFTGTAEKEMKGLEEQAVKYSLSMASSDGINAEAGVLNKKAKLLDYINQRSNNLTAEQKEQLKAQIEISDVIGKRVVSIDEEIKKEEKLIETIKRRLVISGATKEVKDKANIGFEQAHAIGKAQAATTDLQKLSDNKNLIKDNRDAITQRLKALGAITKDNDAFGENTHKELDKLFANDKFFTKDGKLRIKGLDIEGFNNALDEISRLLENDLSKAAQTATENVDTELAEEIRKGIEVGADKGADELRKELVQATHDAVNQDIKNDADKNVDNNTAIKFSDKIIAGAQAISAFTSVITSLKGAWETIKDPDMSGWDKFIAIISSASGVIMTLTFALNSTTISMLSTAGASLASFVPAIGSAIASVEGLTIAGITLNATFWYVTAAIVAAVAVIGTLVFIGKKIYEWFNKDKIALEKANEELENSKKAADNASAAYDDLKSSIDSLESAQNTLSNLTKGTLEWKEAVLKVNQQVLDLIEKYPELAQYMTNTDGVLGFQEGALDKAVQAQLNQTQAFQQLTISRQREVTEKEAANKRDFTAIAYTEKNDPTQRYDDRGNYNTSEGTPSIITEEQLKEIARNLKYTESGEIDFDAMGLADKSEEFKEALSNNIPVLEKLKGSITATDMELQSYDKTLATSWVAKNAEGQSEEMKTAVALGMSKILDEQRDTIDKDFTTDETEIYKQFAEYSGMSETSLKKAVEEDETYTIDELRDALINEQANRLAYDEVLKRLEGVEKYTSNAGYNILEDIILSGADKTTYDALDTDSSEFAAFKTLIENADTKLKELLGGEEIWEAIHSAITAADYEQTSAENRKERYEAKESTLAKSNEMDTEALNKYQESLEEDLPGLNKLMENHDQLALDITEDTFKWTENGNKLVDVLDDQNDALSDKKNVEEYRKALTKVAEATTNLLGTEVDSNFVETHLSLIKKALNGSREAVIELERLAFEASLIKIKPADITEEDIANAINPLYEFLQNQEVGELQLINLDGTTTELYNQLLNIQQMMGWGAEQAATAFADALHIDIDPKLFEPEMVEADINEVQAHEVGGITTVTDKDGKVLSSFVTNDYAKFQQSGKIVYPVFGKNKTVTNNNKGSSGNFKGFFANKTKTPKSSSGSGSSKKDKKKASDEIERYHEETRTLSTLEKQLDRIADAKDRAYGSDKLKAIDDEIAKLGELADAQQDMVDAVKENYDKDRAAAANIGAQFDPDTGEITNWEELRQKALDKFNNSGRTEKDEEEYNRIKEILDQYEETHDKLMEEEDKLEDYLDQIMDAKIAKIQYQVEVKVEIEDTEIEYLDYLLSKLEDKEFAAADAMRLLNQQTQSWLDKYQANVEGLYKTINELGISLDDAIGIMTGSYSQDQIDALGLTEEQLETIRGYGKEFINIAEALDQLKEAFSQELTDAIQEGIDAFDEIGEKIDHVTSTLEHYKNIVDIIGQDTLGVSSEQMLDLMQTAVDSSVASLANAQETLNYLQAQRQAIENSDLPEDEKNKQLKDIDAKIRQAQSSVQSGLEGVLNTIVDQFSTSLELATKEFEKSMSGAFGSLEKLQEAFDRQKEIDDLYVDDYKKIYELTKLTRDINKSIDETDNIKAKQALRDLQKEINDLQKDGTQLSEYDIEMLNKKYELRLAEIALEEAQNAKSQVRMTRDSEGNWSYTYTADENSIAEAEQNYEDKLYAAQETNQEYIKNLQDQIISSYAAMMQAIKQLGPDATQEEINAIRAHYEAIMEAQTQQMNNAMEDSNEILGFMSAETEGWVNSFDETTLSALTGYQTMEEYQSAFGAATTQMMSDISAAMTTYQTNIKTAMDTCGLSVEDFGKQLDTVLNGEGGIKDQIDGLETETTDLVDTVSNNVSTALESLAGFYSTYSEKIALATGETWGLKEALQALIDAEPDDPQQQPQQEPQQQQPQNNNTGPTWSRVKAAYNKINTGAWGTGAQRYSDGKADGYTEAEIQMAQKLINLVYGGMSMEAAKTKLGFFTGGYTGEWGSSGRLAFLHEKELVLNKEDTENMLKSIGMIRDISNLIDLNAASAMFSSLTTAAVPVGNQGITQEITINAEFPDVTDRDEISAAFDSLFIRASQYANRKNK